ncbi:MAG: 6-phosphogluconolactonase [Erythrobacter sp.]
MRVAHIVQGAGDSAIASWIASRMAMALDQTQGAQTQGAQTQGAQTQGPQTQGAQTQGRVAMAFPGGSTPGPIFAELTKQRLDFSRLEIWPTDDRCVSQDHPASNIGALRQLFAPLGAKVEPLEENAQVPSFALAWFGMGADGHIASLFPSTDPRIDDPARVRRITPDPLPPEAPFDRITLTLPALIDSRTLVLVIRGAEKRAILEEAARGDNDLPIARLLRGVAADGTRHVTCFT